MSWAARAARIVAVFHHAVSMHGTSRVVITPFLRVWLGQRSATPIAGTGFGHRGGSPCTLSVGLGGVANHATVVYVDTRAQVHRERAPGAAGRRQPGSRVKRLADPRRRLPPSASTPQGEQRSWMLPPT